MNPSSSSFAVPCLLALPLKIQAPRTPSAATGGRHWHRKTGRPGTIHVAAMSHLPQARAITGTVAMTSTPALKTDCTRALKPMTCENFAATQPQLQASCGSRLPAHLYRTDGQAEIINRDLAPHHHSLLSCRTILRSLPTTCWKRSGLTDQRLIYSSEDLAARARAT